VDREIENGGSWCSFGGVKGRGGWLAGGGGGGGGGGSIRSRAMKEEILCVTR
jgi:hypothetical protein